MGKRGPKAPAPTKPMTDKEFDSLVQMIRIQCTCEEISGILDMSEDTLNRRLKERGEANFAGLYKKHQHEGRASLRRDQWKSSHDGNVTMQIWLGKQNLGQRDKSDVDQKNSLTITLAPDTDEL